MVDTSMAAAWTGCTKPPVTRKKVEPRRDPGLCCFYGSFLKGVGEKRVVLAGHSVVLMAFLWSFVW